MIKDRYQRSFMPYHSLDKVRCITAMFLWIKMLGSHQARSAAFGSMMEDLMQA
jgi:hypothetical protein